jgi:hypothetical protein
VHTPGPWAVKDDVDLEDCEARAIDAPSAQRIVAFSACTFFPTEPNGFGEALGRYRVTDEDTANTRLIAAAPELLEALRNTKDELIALYEQLYPNDESENDTTLVIDHAIGVIEKATGT